MGVTWNTGTGIAVSNGGFSANVSSSSYIARTNIGRETGKYYWEITVDTITVAMIGVTNSVATSYSHADARFYYYSGVKYPGALAYGASYTKLDTIGIFLNIDKQTVTFYKNGVSQGVAFTTLTTGEIFPSFTSGSSSGGGQVTANFGESEFKYLPQDLPKGTLSFDGTQKLGYKKKLLFLQNDGTFRSIIKGEISKTDAIPKMTNATNPSGKVTESTYHASYPSYGAFDDYPSSNGWLTVSNITTGWLAYEFPNTKLISGYSIIVSVVARAPKTWTFEGSENGAEWVVLDNRVNVSDWSTTQKSEFYFDNNKEYKHYRIHITANNGDTSYLSITEMEMFEKPKKDVFNKIPSSSEQSFINHGMDSIQPNGIFQNKNYILQGTVSEDLDGLWKTKLDTKPLSIGLN